MPLHLTEDHVNNGLVFADGKLDWEHAGVVFAGRYLDNTASSDTSATFIDADTNTNGAWTFSLTDATHTAGMHYWIRVDVGAAALTVARAGGSTKTISGNFVGQTLSGATSINLLRDDGILRIQPSGDNWTIY